MGEHGEGGFEVDLSRRALENLSRRVVELLVEMRVGAVPRLLDARELAEMLGVRPRWVHEHASELGAIRLGEGPRAPLRFDPVEAIARLPRYPDGTAPTDSLSERRRATVLARRRSSAGRRRGISPSGPTGGRRTR
jgi:hypothetical protein